jgi:hypothetical protein
VKTPLKPAARDFRDVAENVSFSRTGETLTCSATVNSGESRRGFALLIVVTLLAFIVVLLLGLAVYTRVETAVAGNTQRQAQARENALLALNVAIGQLQQHAGPDTRITATAENFGAVDGTRHYTGVWSSNATETETPGIPRTWLISGNEMRVPDTSEDATPGTMIAAPLAITPAAPGNRTVDLVGRNSTGSTNRSAFVVAPLVDVTATGVSGSPATANTTVGRYAWWVGDQGVKASVALPDKTETVSFAPFDSAELRGRLRQQLPLGAGAADAAGEPLFEPRDANNANLVANDKIASQAQLAFVRNTANAQLGLARVQQNFHAWSPNNFAVLADTKLGGLRQDLSLTPGLLGVPFTAWVNYPAYMEKLKPDAPTEPTTEGEGTTTTPTPTSTAPVISPAYGDDPLRRRYVMTPHLRTGNTGGSHQVGPVLTYFLLTFNVRTEDGSAADRPLEIRARWMISLWNPYTSALVPETLQADITGLPSINVVNEEPTRAGVVAQIPLHSTYGSPLRINLPWNSEAPTSGTVEDRQSWLPGRVYTWRSAEDKTKSSSPPTEGYASAFYSRTLNDGGDGVIRPVAGALVNGDDPCHLESSGGAQLRIRIYATRADGTRVQLGNFWSPQFVTPFITQPQTARRGDYQFSYVFRLAESLDTPTAPATWLTAPSRDPRLSRLSGEFFVVGENGDDPAQYGDSYSKISSPDRLLDRAENGYSYNEDVPLFELPRGPILSMGALQHFRIVGSRPFMIGNPWGSSSSLNSVPLNSLFDRFFFSGLADGVVPTTTAAGDVILPNPLLKPLRTIAGTRVTADELRATATATPPDDTTGGDTPTDEDPPGEETPTTTTPTEPSAGDSRSSKYLLQSAAFNLNSVNASAWAAVLRTMRFPSPQAFSYLDVSPDTGTAADTSTASVSSGEAQFFRFSQSAQETYKAEPGLASNGESASPANTHLFRRGMRTLSAAQVMALATKIVELIGVKHAAADPAGGPFRSIEEFLAPSTLHAGVDAEGNVGAPRSLLEASIADAGINADIAEFSSQWLTQGDVMTALAPILFARSDTFIIRTYGEAINPTKLPLTYVTGGVIPNDAIEGRAWAEAIVQRVPEYLDRSDPPETLAPAFDAPSDPEDATSLPTKAHQLNKQFGRRFKVVSFRWLTRSDI